MLKLVFYRKKVAMKDMSFDKFSNIIYLLICKESFCIGGISIIRMYGSLRFEEIVWVCHCFEFKVVPCWVFKEHGELLSRQSRKPQMRLYNKLHLRLGQPFTELMKFLSKQHHSKMRHRYIVLIDMIAMLLRFEFCSNEAYPQQMIIEFISYCAICSIDFFGFQYVLIEAMGNCQ